MAKGYWIVRVDVADQEKYKDYIAANAPPLKQYGARFLVRAASSRQWKAAAAAATP